MKVLLVHGWHPVPGGTEGYVRRVRRGLEEAGIEVRLLASGAGSAADDSADYVAYGTTSPVAQSFLQVVNPGAVSTARRAVREFQPDVALVGVFANFLSPAILPALGGVPTVLAVVDYKVVCPNGRKLLPDGTICTDRHGPVCITGGCTGLLHWLRDRPRYALMARALDRADQIITVSRYVQDVLDENGIRAETLPWPVDAPPPDFTRRPSERPCFLYAGRLAPEKGGSTLLRAFRTAAERYSDATLGIAGTGPEGPSLRRLAVELGLEERVSFLGWLEGAELEHEFARAWAVVVPSRWPEPLGLVAVEAGIRGVPVIASRTGGLAEVVDEGTSGLLVPNGDAEALADAMLRIVEGTAFVERSIPERVRTATATRHSVERHVEALRGLFSDVMQGAGQA